MDLCAICGGEKRRGRTTYSVELGFGVVVIRHVPALICTQCAEEWIEADVAKELEKIVEVAKNNKLEVEVVAFK